MKIVIKIGSSSLTNDAGEIRPEVFAAIASDITELRRIGHEVVLVSSGAVAAGMGALSCASRPAEVGALQALAAVGQPLLMQQWANAFAHSGNTVGQVLVSAADFRHRKQYLHARETLSRLLAFGVVPLVNENDTIASDELRYGDNDRIAALVAHLVDADLLLLLTDIEGVFTADPRHDANASLIEEILAVDDALQVVAGGAGSDRGSGGMATKLAAAKIAAWSGVRTVIAKAQPEVILAAVAGGAIGTSIPARADRLAARKLWIAFACESSGHVVVDDGAVTALSEGGRSLLPAGILTVVGTFEEDDAIEVHTTQGSLVAKGIARMSARELGREVELRSERGSGSQNSVAIHRDDMVMLIS